MAATELAGPPERFFGGRAADLFLRPWLDGAATPAVTRLYLPLGVAWAAAESAQGDLAELARLSEWRGRRIERLRPGSDLARRRREQLAKIDAEWRAALFGEAPPEQCAQLEDRRRHAADAYLSARFRFLSAHLRASFPGVRFDVAPPAAVAARHGPRLEAAETAFAISDAQIDESVTIDRPAGAACWIRWPGLVAGAADEVWAKVSLPTRDLARAPSLVLAHGIGMETDHWARLVAPQRHLLDQGWVIIEPEGPWHGRRRKPGRHAGETVIGGGPMGFLDYLDAHVRELGQAVAWARERFGGPVAIGGVSLGALTAAKALDAARHWPKCARPDAAMLSTVTGELGDIAQTSGFLRSLGAPAALRRVGWTAADLARWTPLLQPSDGSAVSPDRTVVILGDRDDVLPISGGEALVQRWAVPPDNVFRRNMGHFSASLALCRDREPFDRLAALCA